MTHHTPAGISRGQAMSLSGGILSQSDAWTHLISGAYLPTEGLLK